MAGLKISGILENSPQQVIRMAHDLRIARVEVEAAGSIRSNDQSYDQTDQTIKHTIKQTKYSS